MAPGIGTSASLGRAQPDARSVFSTRAVSGAVWFRLMQRSLEASLSSPKHGLTCIAFKTQVDTLCLSFLDLGSINQPKIQSKLDCQSAGVSGHEISIAW